MFFDKLFISLKEFIFLFCEISFLFLLINMIVFYIDKKYTNLFKNHLKKDGFQAYIKAIILGSLTPFCSCSSIPLLNAFLRAKVPLGVCISYLITSPLINPIVVAMFIVSFGIKVTLFYVSFLIFAILIVSFFISKINTQKFFNECFLNDLNDDTSNSYCNNQKLNFIFKANFQSNKIIRFKIKKENLLKELFLKSFKDYKKIFIYIIIGMAIGAIIHSFFPKDFFEIYLKDYGILAVFIAAFIGVLLYMNCTAMIPVALTLIQSGIPLGIMMSFLIAGAGCSLPELILLKRIFKLSFLILFASIIVLIAIIFGILIFFI
ncbi:permease [Campylobacter sp. TTU-622]|uniref:permease n=1 Tax=unclassified Campylobacter TaxID=2593542 RepID=UPI0019075F83|nr:MULTISPECIES: permease [unclassified Campylobacter]MBK1972171.1 permease [Campylobacter sp. TTU_617]MBK1973244.1 permease [Campylobacter sp. TTU-622]